MKNADRLLTELGDRSGRRARIPIDVVWEAFRAVVRGYTGNIEARPRLAMILECLRENGALDVPKSRRLWDASADPPLPTWVQLVVSRRSPASEPDHRVIAWPPELAFVAKLSRAPLLDELLAIRRFLADGGRERIWVPARERSLEVFGEEKRLAALRKTTLFGPGRLDLELLRCYAVAPPLVWEPGPGPAIGRSVLVLENLDTYHSFCRWNEDAARYGAVAYGHGTEFVATVRDLPRVCDAVQSSAAEYFGDIDYRGLQIPMQARLVLAGETSAISLGPAARWYDALLEHADRTTDSNRFVSPTDAVLLWLPEELRDRAAPILARGRRLPQEHIGLAHLTSG